MLTFVVEHDIIVVAIVKIAIFNEKEERMVREIFHHEQLYRREAAARMTVARHLAAATAPAIGARLARWFGLRLIRLGARLLRYAARRRASALTYAR